MKSLSVVLNIVLLVAVAVLFYLHFSNGSEVTEADQQPIEEEVSDLNIAYVNADTVLDNYEFFKAKQEELEALQAQLDNQYRSRAQGLQQEVSNYQQSVQNLTIGQAKALEEDLMKKQQNLRMYQESLAQELIKKESEINQELYEKVTAYIKDYSEENNIEVVVKYNQGSDILYAGEAMDITYKIVEGLNERYQQENSSANQPADQ